MNDPMPRPYDVILPGVYFCDLVFTGLPTLPALGKEIFGKGFDILPGGTYNTVFTLHRLGLHPGWVADFGNDYFSQFVLRTVRKAGIDDALFRLHDFPLQSVSASLSFPEDRAFISYVEPYDHPLPFGEIQRFRPPCLLLPYLYHGPQATQLMRAARQQGTWIYMDCQDTDLTISSDGVSEAIQLVDVFAPNALEALQLTGEKTIEAALECLAELAPLIIIKLGEQGVIARRGAETFSVPAIRVKVIDTTAAGDCFNAGFVFGHLNRKPLETCLGYGNICGGLATTARGCQAAPSAKQLVTRYRRLMF